MTTIFKTVEHFYARTVTGRDYKEKARDHAISQASINNNPVLIHYHTPVLTCANGGHELVTQ